MSCDGIDEFVYILRLDAQGEGVHTAEGLEEHAFALHDRHTGLRADIAQAQDGRAVGDDGAEVPAAGQLVAFLKILLDLTGTAERRPACRRATDRPSSRPVRAP